MGYCRKCNNYVDDNARFCGKCGSADIVTSQYVNNNVAVSNNVEKGPWKVFAKLGLIFGIIGLSCAAFFSIVYTAYILMLLL